MNGARVGVRVAQSKLGFVRVCGRGWSVVLKVKGRIGFGKPLWLGIRIGLRLGLGLG